MCVLYLGQIQQCVCARAAPRPCMCARLTVFAGVVLVPTCVCLSLDLLLSRAICLTLRYVYMCRTPVCVLPAAKSSLRRSSARSSLRRSGLAGTRQEAAWRSETSRPGSSSLQFPYVDTQCVSVFVCHLWWSVCPSIFLC
jgi:hypothetical protein